MLNPAILVIYKRSSYSEMLADQNTKSLKSLQKRKDPILDPMIKSHENHRLTLDAVDTAITQMGLNATWRHDLSGIIPDDFDMVVTLGGDGTLLHASHSIGSTPIFGVNSSPNTSIGYFTISTAADFAETMKLVLEGKIEATQLHRMEVSLNGELVGTRVLNDVLFSHICPASTSRYIITHGTQSETQLSSGVWVCTAAGSTAATSAAGGDIMKIDEQRLQYIVREPGYCGGADNPTQPKLIKGYIEGKNTLSIRSKTSAAKLYMDGPHVVVPVQFGDIITFSSSNRPLNIYKNKN